MNSIPIAEEKANPIAKGVRCEAEVPVALGGGALVVSLAHPFGLLEENALPGE